MKAIIKYSLISLTMVFLSSFNHTLLDRDIHNSKTTGNSLSNAGKLALIIANGSYDENKTGWSQIASLNDIPLVKEALLKQGFENKNIRIISDATKEQMISALKELTELANSGDIVVVHYSGHGQQIFDDDDDELDGFDEALIPTDAPAAFHKIPGYEGQNHLRDDEFGYYINILRQRVGENGQVLVVLDSCHSGSATRGGSNNSRGGQAPFLKPGYEPQSNSIDVGSGLFEEKSSRGNTNSLGKFILITGARANERNYETKDANGNSVGSLSMSFSQIMNNVEPGETYRSLFSKIQSVMYDCVPYQTPTIEGDIDIELFGGSKNYISQTPYFNIVNIINENQIEIDGGFVHNLTEGTKVGLYKVGTKNPNEAPNNLLSEGIIKELSNFKAMIECDQKVNLDNIKSAWVFVKELGVSAYRLQVNLDGLSNKLKTEIKKNIISNPLIVESQTNYDYRISEKASSKTSENPELILKGSDIQLDVDLNDLNETLSGIARVEFLKSIEIYDYDCSVEIEFIPVVMKKKSYNEFEEVERKNISEYTKEGIVEFPLETQLKLKIKNKGLSNCYFNIIDIQPDGVINPVAPNIKMGLYPDDCLVKAGEEIELPNYFIKIGKPTGNEIFKVFATTEPLNLEPIVNSIGIRGSAGRSSNMFKGFEEILSEAYGTRGTQGQSISFSEGSVYNMIFKIVE